MTPLSKADELREKLKSLELPYEGSSGDSTCYLNDYDLDQIMPLIATYTASKVLEAEKDARIDELQSLRIGDEGSMYSVIQDEWLAAEDCVDERIAELQSLKDKKEVL